MPIELQYVSFAISILGFLITLGTFYKACCVNKKILQLYESEKFHVMRQEILDKLEGYILSIEQDHLYKSDSKKTLVPNILLHLKDLETRYTHLSRKTKKNITNTKKYLNCPPINWQNVAESLIALKNSIEKEI